VSVHETGWLDKWSKSLGGRVESKVPRQGYILVQPGTAEEERLRLCWASPDRPERYLVPYTYVEACKIAGMLLKQIFVEHGIPIKMHIHPSIANVNARTALSQRIMVSETGFSPSTFDRNFSVPLAFRWRPYCLSSVRSCNSRRPEHRSLPTPCKVISRGPRQVYRILFMG
jgi:hypothetical protein